MKKIILTIALVAIIMPFSFGQGVKKEMEAEKTKMAEFSSKTGVITKTIDTKLANLNTTYSKPETRIRKVSSGSVASYFYQIEKKKEYSNVTASIEYSDLIEVIKAIKALKEEVVADVASDPYYLENKFTTEDGFKVGYFLSKGKTTWYLELTKYGSDNVLFISDVEIIEIAFTEAKNKIDSLK